MKIQAYLLTCMALLASGCTTGVRRNPSLRPQATEYQVAGYLSAQSDELERLSEYRLATVHIDEGSLFRTVSNINVQLSQLLGANESCQLRCVGFTNDITSFSVSSGGDPGVAHFVDVPLGSLLPILAHMFPIGLYCNWATDDKILVVPARLKPFRLASYYVEPDVLPHGEDWNAFLRNVLPDLPAGSTVIYDSDSHMLVIFSTNDDIEVFERCLAYLRVRREGCFKEEQHAQPIGSGNGR